MTINPKINITSFTQLREYVQAYRLVTGHGIEEVLEEEAEETEETEEQDGSAPKKPRGTRTPNHKKAAEKYATWDPESSGCLSGSGKETPSGRDFASGGQHVLSAIAGAVNAGELDFSKIAPHAYQYLIDCGRYPDLVDRLQEALDE